jgi:serine/threonine-protein phosphatase 5
MAVVPPTSPGGAGAGAGAAAGVAGVDEEALSAGGVSLRFVKALMEGFRAGSADKCLHKRFVWELLLRVRPLLASYRSLVHVPWPAGAPHFNVCGDTHGQLYDTLNIFKLAGAPSPTNPFVFNGDFVDRGSFSVENVLLLFAWKLLLPDSVHLTRGNHETRNMNLMYGFSGEVKAKYCQQTMDLFAEVFQAIPLAVCIDRRVLVLHGGLFQQDGVKLDEIARIDRFREPPEGGGPTGAALMSDLMWSDPQPFPGRGPSKRGVGQSFGPDVTARFLADNSLEYLIRSHEVKDDGYVVEHAGKCITVFSAPNYCDMMGNKGAVCRVSPNAGEPASFITYSAVPHPPVKPMAYAGGGPGGSMASMFGL